MNASDISEYIGRIGELPLDEQKAVLKLVEQLEEAKKREAARSGFLGFVKQMWPGFIEGRHHKIIADAFDRVLRGECKRLTISLPPRHTKSEFASILLPAYAMGLYPDRKVIQASHTAELAVDFGRKARNIMDEPAFKEVFPDVGLRADSKASGRWSTNKGGQYFAVGVGGAIAGKGADLCIIDDPVDEQTATMGQTDPAVYDKLYDWYTTGPRQRLQPGGAIIIVMTRWHKRDLIGRVVEEAFARDGDEWEVIEFPAIMPSGDPLWPEFWPLKELEALKNELPVSKWNAQYMQNPTNAETALLKREWWRKWEREELPPCEAIMVSWDTAYTKNERSDYSACTTWGVFNADDKEGRRVPNLILLDAFKGRFEFPELKREAYAHWKEWQPDIFLIEAKAAGLPLISELRAMGIPVSEFTPVRGARGVSNDKIARVNSITDIFASGCVWAPNRRWAEEVIEECADFPFGSHDDYVDTVSQALLRFRQGGWVRLDSDEWDDTPKLPRRADYY